MIDLIEFFLVSLLQLCDLSHGGIQLRLQVLGNQSFGFIGKCVVGALCLTHGRRIVQRQLIHIRKSFDHGRNFIRSFLRRLVARPVDRAIIVYVEELHHIAVIQCNSAHVVHEFTVDGVHPSAVRPVGQLA